MDDKEIKKFNIRSHEDRKIYDKISELYMTYEKEELLKAHILISANLEESKNRMSALAIIVTGSFILAEATGLKQNQDPYFYYSVVLFIFVMALITTLKIIERIYKYEIANKIIENFLKEANGSN